MVAAAHAVCQEAVLQGEIPQQGGQGQHRPQRRERRQQLVQPCTARLGVLTAHHASISIAVPVSEGACRRSWYISSGYAG